MVDDAPFFNMNRSTIGTILNKDKIMEQVKSGAPMMSRIL